MSVLVNDLRHSVRLLRRTPGFTSVAVLVLALGIGANTAVFSLVNALVLQHRPGRIDQLQGVFNRDRNKPDRFRDFSYPAYVDMRERHDIFDSLMAHTFSTVGITEGDTTKQTFASLVSANYFSTLGVRLAGGRAFTAEEDRPGSMSRVAIASYAVWRRKGFDPAFIGTTVRVNGADYATRVCPSFRRERWRRSGIAASPSGACARRRCSSARSAVWPCCSRRLVCMG
jgi:hypothetical protein